MTRAVAVDVNSSERRFPPPTMGIEEVEAKMAISQMLYRYASGLDSQDWAAWRTIFTGEDSYFLPSCRGATGWLTGWRSWPRLLAFVSS